MEISSEIEESCCYHNPAYSTASGDGSAAGSCRGNKRVGRKSVNISICENIPPEPFQKFSTGGESSYIPVRIDRSVVHQLDLYSKLKDEEDRENDPGETCCSKLSENCRRVARSCKQMRPWKWIKRRIPILDWLPKYRWKEDITSDLAAGFTVAVMHVPQGMAYALLAEVPPIVGIYMAFFPIFVYAVMGASRHVSMGLATIHNAVPGTFAVICLMTGKVVNTVLQSKDESGGSSHYTPIQIATVVSLVVGGCQILMGILHLGAVSLLLSPSLVGGFTTGAAFHVLTSQVRNFFGIKLPRRNGLFKIPMTYYDIASHIQDTNVTAVIVSVVTVAVLVIYTEIIKPYISKKTKIPIPIELLVVIGGTLVSYYMDLHEQYGVAIIYEIPTGLPTPMLPPLELIGEVLVDSAVIAFVSYAISISMAKIFAKRYHYKVDPNQELIAHGSSNICGSFFSCAPVSVSLSRSLVQEVVGGKTQLTSLFSCLILVCVLLWIGPLFEALPNCVLAGIIVVALKGMFLQALEFPKFWRISKLHGLTWIVSFLATVVLDIVYGLALGMIISTVVLLWRSNRLDVSVLGCYANSDLYIDVSSNDYVHQIPGIKIIKYTGNLNFATIEKFIELIGKIVDVHNSVDTSKKGQLRKAASMGSTVAFARNDRSPASPDRDDVAQIRWVILDFSSVSSVGPGSVKALVQLHTCFENEGIIISYAGCAIPVIQEMSVCGFLQTLRKDVLFPTVHDAVLACQTYDSLHEEKEDNSQQSQQA